MIAALVAPWYPTLWFVWILAGLTLEVYALWNGLYSSTLSDIVWEITTHYPLLPLAFGLLMGHFFWQRVV